jgi:methionyl-tRNA formyltransferase
LSLHLAALGAELLVQILPGYLLGDITPEAQDDSQATYAPMLSKKDGELVFTDSAQALARRVSAFNPWPGAFTHWPGGRLKVLFAHPSTSHSPGVGITAIKEGLPAVGTGDGLLVLDEVQPAGKKPMAGHVFLRGARNWSGGISLGKGKPN